MSEQLTITITAKDGATQTFTAVSNGAKRMGDELEQAGQDGKRGLDDLGRSAESNAEKMERMKAEASAIGAVMGTLALGVIQAGSAFRDQERQMDALNRMYEDGADRIIDYADAIQEATRFSDDAARQSAIIFNTLNENYGMTLDQIETLMMRSADLAELHGKSFVEASQMVQNALRGEAEYIEQLGVSLQDNYVASQYAARGLGEWTKVTNEAERAAFRYILLMEQTADAQGYAAERAATAGGQFRQLINTLQDGVQVLGGWLGPIGDIAAELAPIAIAAPVVAAGLGRVTAALRGTAVAAAAVRLGPLAIGAAALVATGAALHNWFRNANEDAIRTAEGIEGLNEEIERLKLNAESGTASALQGVVSDLEEIERVVNQGNVPNMLEELGIAQMDVPTYLTSGLHDDLESAKGDVDDFIAHVTDTYNQLPNEEAKQAYLGWVQDLLRELEYTAEGTNLGEIIAEGMAPASEIPEVMDAINASIGETSESGGLLTEVFGQQREAIFANQAALADYIETQARLTEAADEFHASMQEWLADGDNILTFLQSMGELADREFRLSLDIMDTGAALDQVLRTFEQIDSLGQRSSAAGAIMDALFGPGGDPNDGIGPLRDLYDVGRIGQQQFNETIEHGIAIQYRAAEAEALLNEIRVDQVPLLREQQDAYVDNIERLTQLNPLEQRRALMLQDTAVQAQLAEYASLAYAASVGEIPEAVATDVILNAAEADAGMKDLLLQVGLLEEVDGEIRVAFPEADATIQALDRVARLMIEIEARAAEVDPYQLAVEILGEEDARQLWGLMDENDGRTAEAQFNVDTLGGDLLASLLGDLDVVDGRTAEAAVNTTTTGGEDVQQLASDVIEMDGTQANATVVGTVVNAEAIGDVFELLRSIEETGAATLSVTVDVDMSALNPFGLGFSDGGGAAGFTPMQASIDVAIGQNALDDWTTPELEAATVNVATSGEAEAVAALGRVINTANVVDALAPDVYVTTSGSGLAIGALDSVHENANTVDRLTPDVAVSVSGAGTAVAALNSVAAAANSIPTSRTVSITTYNDTINRTFTQGQAGRRHGGIPGYAGGGVLFEAGEAGPEWLHFAGGGMALLPHHGLYEAPAGSYVSPSNTYDYSDRSQGGDVYELHIHGNVYGIDDLAEAMASAVAQRRRGYAGVNA